MGEGGMSGYTTTPNYGLKKPVENADDDAWGGHINSTMDTIDGALKTNADRATQALNGVGRNLIHNPLFNIAQRGAGPFTTLAFTVDRWLLAFVTDTPSLTRLVTTDADRAAIGDEAASYMLNNTFTGNAAAGAYSLLSQRIEGVRRLAGKTVTVSFWAVASTALKLGVSLTQNFGTGGSPSAILNLPGQAVQLSTTWTRYSVTTTLPSSAGKTLGTSGDDQTSLNLWFSSGATNAAIAGNIGVQSGSLNIWGVQLETGSVATPLEKPDPRYDLSNCQRFYQIGQQQQQMQSQGAGTTYTTLFPLPVTMRATPIITGNFTTQIGGTGSVAGIGSTTAGTGVQFNIAVSGATGNAVNVFGTWTASADL
jgi:hypothetical protein